MFLFLFGVTGSDEDIVVARKIVLQSENGSSDVFVDQKLNSVCFILAIKRLPRLIDTI